MSIVLAVAIFYPFIADFWEKAPLDSSIDNIKLESVATDALVSEQFKFLESELKDPRARCATAKILGDTRNKLASKMLEDFVASEKDEDILIESLFSVWRLREIRKPANIEFYRQNLFCEVPLRRAYSRILFIVSGGTAEEVFKSLEIENLDFAAEMAWNELFHFGKSADCAKARPFLKSPLAANRRGAAKFLGAKEENPSALAEDFRIIEGEDISVAISFAQGIVSGGNKAGIGFLDKLSTSSSVPLRSTIALLQIPDAGAEKILMRLNTDKDCEIRRVACLSLAAFNTPSSIETLISSLGDPDMHVRAAAEDSLIKLNPANEFIEKIAALLDDAVARNSAIRVLGELRHKKYAEKIFGILQESDEVETLRRAVRALDIFDFKKSCAKISALADHGDCEIRAAVASALGTFNDPSSYATLRKLDKDSVVKVRLEAINAIGRTASDSFADILEENLKEYTVPSGIRANAAWAAAKTGSCNSKIGDALEKIVAKAVIPAGMGQQVYDALFARTSAFWALMVLSQKNPAFSTKAKTILKKYQENPPADDLKGEALDQMLYYFEQAICYVEKRKVEPMEVPVPIMRDVFPVNKIRAQE